MVRKLARVVVPFFVFASFSFVSVGASAELKIAVLDTQRAVVASDEAQGLIEKLRKEVEREQTTVKSLGDDILAMQDKLKKDGEVMSASEARKLSKDIEDKQIDYQFQLNKLQKELNDRQQELFQQLIPKVDAVLKDLIELEGYDLIMERSSLRYANSKHDITRRVTEKLNEKR